MANTLSYFYMPNGIAFDFYGITYFGSCTTSATVQAKTASVDGFTHVTLRDGIRVVIRFMNAQTFNGAPTLNVSGTGAKQISIRDGGNAARYEWAAGSIIGFIYYGGQWVMESGCRASTSCYGRTMLSNTIANNQTVALTPKAVYDAGYITSASLPTKVSDLTNDSGFITLADLPVYDGTVI